MIIRSIMKSIAVICVLFGVAFATPDAARGVRSADIVKRAADTFDNLDELGRIEIINEFVDMALEEARYFMMEQGFDPMKLPDFYKKISFKPIIITYWGDFNLSRGWLQDASTIQRNGDVNLDYSIFDRTLTLDVPIKFTDFLFDYKYKIKIMGLGPGGGLDGKTVDVRCSFTLAINFETLRVELKRFNVDHVGKISLKFNGNILTDWLINIVTAVTVTFFKGLIAWICEIIVKDVLQNLVDVINSLLAGLVPDLQSVQPLLMYQYITQ